jgi:hypothetical protein
MPRYRCRCVTLCPVIPLRCGASPERGTIPTSGPSKSFPVPYTDDFEGYPLSSEAAYFADQAGSWEIVQASDLSHGLVMRQTVRVQAVCHGGS